MKMISRFVAAMLLISVIASCKKNHDNNTSTGTNTIIGTWELSQIQGSMLPAKDFPAGNGNILAFTATTYAFRANGQLQKNGRYELKDDLTAPQNICLVFPDSSFTKRIIYDGNDTTRKVFINVTNNQLTLASGCFAVDGGSKNIYRRVGVEY